MRIIPQSDDIQAILSRTSSFRSRHPTLSVLLLLTASLLSAYWFFGAALKRRLTDALDLYSFNGDALQHIAPLWFLWEPARASNDFVATYYLQAILPALFKAIYAALTLAYTPIVASKIVFVVLSLLFIIAVSLTSLRLAGPVASYLSFMLASGGVIKNLYFIGGIQRGFGICISSFFIYFLASGNSIALAVLSVLAASLYPAACVLGILCLGLLLVLPAAFRGGAANWRPRKRLLLFVTTSAVCCLVLFPQLRAGAQYGERLSIRNEDEFPEWGPNGRYTQGDRGVPVSFFSRTSRVVASGLFAEKFQEPEREELSMDSTPNPVTTSHNHSSSRRAYTAVAICIALALIALRNDSWRFSPACCRVFIAGFATAIAFTCATLLFPLLYIPSRYIAVGVIPLVPILFPCVLCCAMRTKGSSQRRIVHSLLAGVVGLCALFFLGWSEISFRKLSSAAGYRPLFSFVRSLPDTTVIATWPRGIGNLLPLFTARTLVLFEEGHQVFHRSFTEEARKRISILTQLYSSRDASPVAILKRDYGVSHILLDRRNIDKAPSYFEPYSIAISAARGELPPSELYLSHLAKNHTVFSFGPFSIIEIPKEF
jgi:hypothetical protein